MAKAFTCDTPPLRERIYLGFRREHRGGSDAGKSFLLSCVEHFVLEYSDYEGGAIRAAAESCGTLRPMGTRRGQLR
jgi:hypothetical protein